MTQSLTILIGSDIHLEHEPSYQYLPMANETFRKGRWIGPPIKHFEAKADIVVLAGDIAVGAESTIAYAKAVSLELDGIPVIVIAGNHEHYNCEIHGNLEEFRAAAKKVTADETIATVYFLENDIIEPFDDGYVFIGATLWTDFNIYGNVPLGLQIFDTRMMDTRLITTRNGEFADRPIQGKDTLYWHRESLRYITDQLVQAKVAGKKVIVVTHHAPSSVCDLDPQTPMSPCFISDLEYLMKHVEYAPDVWISGHTHTRADEIIGKTRVVTNCRGYYGQEAMTTDFEWKMIEVK